MENPPDKICVVCGRAISWRKKWEKSWPQVKYCGEACRRRKGEVAAPLEAEILRLLHARAAGLTICPSEVLPAEKKTDKEEMEKVRRAARRLVEKGQIEITQKGKAVDAQTFRGPIRLRLKR